MMDSSPKTISITSWPIKSIGIDDKYWSIIDDENIRWYDDE